MSGKPEVGTLKCPDTGEFCHKTSCYNLGQCVVKGGNANPPASTLPGHASAAGIKCERYGATCMLTHCTKAGVCRGLSGALPSDAALGVKHVPKPATVTAKPSPPCHVGMHKFGVIGTATVWLGARSAVGSRPAQGETMWALKISLIEGDGAIADDHPEGEVLGNRPARDILPRELFRKYEPTPILHIDWPDYGVPTMGREWWVMLYKALAAVNGNVAVYCFGGHGRTGTFAAILAAFGGIDGCPVAYVRNRYCKSTVESADQVEYIEEITGVKTTASPRHGYAGLGAQDLLDDRWEQWGRTYTGPETASEPGYSSDKPPTMSRKRYKKWAHKRRASGVAVLALDELEDQQQVCVNGAVFAYNGETKGFDFVAMLADLTDEPDPADPVA